MYYWAFLIIAIITEVIGTLAMKYSTTEWPTLGLIVMYVMLTVSYSSLAIAVKRISIAVAFGAWESVGLVLITIFSAITFNEPMSLTKTMAIAMIIAGIVLLEHGTEISEQRK